MISHIKQQLTTITPLKTVSKAGPWKQRLTTLNNLMLVLALALTSLLPTTIANAAPEPADVPAFASAWGSEGSGDGEFAYPYSVDVDDNGNVYVVDTDNYRIQKFDSNGTYLSQWGTEGEEDGEFYEIYGIAIDNYGNVYVADTDNSRIQKFDSNGTYLSQWGTYGSDNGEFDSPYGVAIDSSNNIYVADIGNDRIQKFDSDGIYMTQWGNTGSDNGEFDRPRSIAVDSDNNVYVSDIGNYRVQKFDSNGTYLTQWGSSGPNDGQFSIIGGLTADRFDSIYVTDTGTGRVQKFDSNGTFLTQWGVSGSGDGEFESPSDIAVDIVGNIYVADLFNYRIQKFTYPPETASLVSSVSGTDIALESTAFTTFSCSTSVAEDSLSTSDPNQDYPLGLVDFCLDVVPGSTNTVSLTFETDLTPDQVTPRKYNPTTQTYTNIPDAQITATTLNSNPALLLTYDITDGGDLDDDNLANGTILDPVGLAIAADATITNTSDTNTLADTGQSANLTVLIGTLLLVLATTTYSYRKRHEQQ